MDDLIRFRWNSAGELIKLLLDKQAVCLAATMRCITPAIHNFAIHNFFLRLRSSAAKVIHPRAIESNPPFWKSTPPYVALGDSVAERRRQKRIFSGAFDQLEKTFTRCVQRSAAVTGRQQTSRRTCPQLINWLAGDHGSEPGYRTTRNT
jgi:hypothetical protein